jgi:hypothetical protein
VQEGQEGKHRSKKAKQDAAAVTLACEAAAKAATAAQAASAQAASAQAAQAAEAAQAAQATQAAQAAKDTTGAPAPDADGTSTLLRQALEQIAALEQQLQWTSPPLPTHAEMPSLPAHPDMGPASGVGSASAAVPRQQFRGIPELKRHYAQELSYPA